MSRVVVASEYTPDGKLHTTCPAALGASFAAGSEEDGPGPGIAKEGEPNPFLAALGRVLFWPSSSLRQCQGVKEIAIPTGEFSPTPWTPEVLPLQLIRIGSLYLATLPGEPTIMSGYRIRRRLAHTLGVKLNQVLVMGYTNAYSHYITTPEEYGLQSYEGGSTLFGPFTQPAYEQELDRLAKEMSEDIPVLNVMQPRDLSCCQRSFQPGVIVDLPGFGKHFGTVLKDVYPSYERGATVNVHFQTGHPKNNLHRNGTFLNVQRQVEGRWVNVADDGDWSTRYHWLRTFGAESVADISWTIPMETPAGSYRIVHYGDAKSLFGDITSFTTTSKVFEVREK